ncbi:MAG: protein kinase domain-containing protein [Candidatus Aminicenantia bacterium]
MPEKVYEEVEILKKHFSGKYEFLELIGQGGFALVWKVRDLYLERLGAIKILYKEYSKDEETIERFRREAKIYANLEHTNIVPIYDIGIVEGIVFLIMKFIEGETLSKIIRREGKLSEKRAVKIMSELLDAIGYIHKKGIIHRDIKPQNIMIDKNDRTILADFGIARTLESTSFTKSGAILGTAYYLSPEQAKGLPIDHRVDIYSAGVTLYEIVTGELPFKGENILMVLYQHVNEPPPLPSKLNPRISPEMESVILKALEKEPANRFSTAEEMKLALYGVPLEPKNVAQPEPLETIEIPEEVILKKTPQKEEPLKFKTAPFYSESIPKRKGFPLLIIFAAVFILVALIAFISIPPLKISLKEISPQKETKGSTLIAEKENSKTGIIEKEKTYKQISEPSLEKKEVVKEEKEPQQKGEKVEPKQEEKKEGEEPSKKIAENQEVKPPPSKKEEPLIPPAIESTLAEKSAKETQPSVIPAKGAIVLTSSHPCTVIIDGDYRYELPPRRTIELSAGVHNVKFVIENYESTSYDVEITRGAVLPLHHKFTPYGKLLVNSFPWGNVKIDGRDFGPSPVETKLSEGEHNIVVEREGYVTVKKTVRIFSGKTEILNINLTKK